MRGVCSTNTVCLHSTTTTHPGRWSKSPTLLSQRRSGSSEEDFQGNEGNFYTIYLLIVQYKGTFQTRAETCGDNLLSREKEKDQAKPDQAGGEKTIVQD